MIPCIPPGALVLSPEIYIMATVLDNVIPMKTLTVKNPTQAKASRSTADELFHRLMVDPVIDAMMKRLSKK